MCEAHFLSMSVGALAWMFVSASHGQACGEPSAGDCCAAQATAFCSDLECCSAVCSIDSYCCTNSWDQICANEAAALCVNCGGGSGGGECDQASATEFFVGTNLFITNLGSGNLDLTGICDPGPFGDDVFYNAAYYRFTPLEDATWTVSTCNLTAWDTRLAVLASCDPFSIIACNDDGDGCSGFSSFLQFSATAGIEYVIVIGGFAPTMYGAGTVLLEVSVTCGDPSTGDCCVAHGGVACSDGACCSAVCTMDSYCCQIQWDQICAYEASFVCGACGAGSCKLPASTVSEAEGCGEDLNGGCNASGEHDPIALGAAVGGSFWADGNVRDTDWYVLTLSEDTAVTVTISSNMPCFAAFVGLDCAGIIGQITNGSCGGTMSHCFAAGAYYIVALPQVFVGFPCGFEFGNEYSLAVSGVPCDPDAPPNDFCANAQVAWIGANRFSNSFATTDQPDATCGGAGAPFLKDVWFTFIPGSNAAYSFETCTGPLPFDTGIEVFDACPADGGVLLGCNDDGAGCALGASHLELVLSRGVTYFIRVGGSNGASGSTDLVIDAGSSTPANDECAGAEQLAAGDTPFSTLGASGATAACNKSGSAAIFNDVWYAYRAASSGTCAISLCSASFDTKIAVFEGSCAGPMIVCNDDSKTVCPGTLRSSLEFEASCGTLYLVTVGAFEDSQFGTGFIGLAQQGECSLSCAGDLTGDGSVTAADLSLVLALWGSAGGDVNGDGLTNATDLSLLLAYWGPCAE